MRRPILTVLVLGVGLVCSAPSARAAEIMSRMSWRTGAGSPPSAGDAGKAAPGSGGGAAGPPAGGAPGGTPPCACWPCQVS